MGRDVGQCVLCRAGTWGGVVSVVVVAAVAVVVVGRGWLGLAIRSARIHDVGVATW